MMADSAGRPVRGAVFTFIFEDYDALKQPVIHNKDWDHYVFSDRDNLDDLLPEAHAFTPWQLLPPLFDHDEPKKRAVGHMIMGHGDLANRGYDITVSIGGQVQINCDLDAFVGACFRESARLMLIRHPERQCIYAEAEACRLLKKDDPDRIARQMTRYIERGHPHNWGLFATGVMGVNHRRPPRNPRLHWWRDMMQDWIHEVMQGSRRDQLALPYVLRNYMAPEGVSEVGWGQVFGHPGAPFLIHPHE